MPKIAERIEEEVGEVTSSLPPMLLLALFPALLEGNYVFATRGRDNQGGRLLTPGQAHPDYPTGSCFISDGNMMPV